MSSTPQYRSVLVPLDGSAFAEQALPVATGIAKAARASVRLVLVHQTATVLKDRRDTGDLSTKGRLAALKAERGYLRQVAARVKESTGTKVTGVTLHGPVAATLGEHIDLTGADLVVMTTHGRGMFERAWLGSVADALLRSVKVPMLLIRPTKEAPPSAELKVSRMLVPLDGSPLSEQIIPPAVAMARLLGAEVSLVQLVEPVVLPSEFPPGITSFDPGLTALMEKQAKDYLDSLAAMLRADGLRVTRASGVTPTVASGLLELAHDPAVGMVALATHGRGGLRRAVLGSVADKLIRGADRPVLVYRPRMIRKSRSGK